MADNRRSTQGSKTHEQFLRTVEKRDERDEADRARSPAKPQARKSEFPVSRGGMNQESDHNKHNHGGQSGHREQKHRPDEEKH